MTDKSGKRSAKKTPAKTAPARDRKLDGELTEAQLETIAGGTIPWGGAGTSGTGSGTQSGTGTNFINT